MLAAAARVRALQEAMVEQNVAACIVTNFDPHHSEYSGPHWLARTFISGFTGSAGDLVVWPGGGGLWTDGRYFIQAEQQLAGTGIALFRARLPDTPSIADHLAATLPEGARVATAGHTMNTAMYRELHATLQDAGITLDTQLDLVSPLWPDRPPRSAAPAMDYPLSFAGSAVAEKLARVRAKLSQDGVDAVLISALPDVAWLLNLRGRDVPYCPLLESFLLVTADRAVLCVAAAKLGKDLVARLQQDGVAVAGYEEVYSLVDTLTGTVSLCPQSTNSTLYRAVCEQTEVRLQASPTEAMKAIKNPVELAALREALRFDGVAMTRFARWLEANVPQGSVTERGAETVLRGYRAELPHFVEESFRTIAGYGPHAALMHYAATETSDATVGEDALFLVDSGGQYLGGTTDITRTFAFGDVGELARRDYTRVLQAVIRLSQTQFRRGARGCNLDIMARGVLWQCGIDYECGTGHGVGQCLVVHEGPQGLNQRLEDVPFEPGMVITNEPGVYREGQHGVRIENIMEVVAAQTTEFGEFYRFETLTLAPIQTAPLLLEEMTADEITWLNAYHARVLAEVGPLLETADRLWLETACAPVH